MRQINNFIDAFEAKCEEKGIKPTEAYKNAGNTSSSYHDYVIGKTPVPKLKAILLAMALKPTVKEMQGLLHYAGFVLSSYIPDDCIVIEAIEKQQYNVTILRGFLNI